MKKLLLLATLFSINAHAAIYCPHTIKCSDTECEIPVNYHVTDMQHIKNGTFPFFQAYNKPDQIKYYNCHYNTGATNILITYDTPLYANIFLPNYWHTTKYPNQWVCTTPNEKDCPLETRE